MKDAVMIAACALACVALWYRLHGLDGFLGPRNPQFDGRCTPHAGPARLDMLSLDRTARDTCSRVHRPPREKVVTRCYWVARGGAPPRLGRGLLAEQQVSSPPSGRATHFSRYPRVARKRTKNNVKASLSRNSS